MCEFYCAICLRSVLSEKFGNTQLIEIDNEKEEARRRDEIAWRDLIIQISFRFSLEREENRTKRERKIDEGVNVRRLCALI